MINMNWSYIVIKDLKCIMREKIAWITMILLPLAVIIVAGFALSGLFGEQKIKMTMVYYYNGNAEDVDSIFHGMSDIDNLRIVKAESEEAGIKMVEESSATALLKIPEDFNINDPKKKTELKYFYDISSQSTADMLYGIIMGNVKSLNNSLVTVKMLVEQQKKDGVYQEGNVSDILEEVKADYHGEQQINITENGIGGDNRARSFYQVIPGFAVMFLLFSILGGSGKLIEERNNKTLRRILISTTKRRDLIIGKWIGMTLQGFIQSVILFLAGAFLFKISLGSITYLLAFLLLAAMCTGAIGVFIASISKSLAQATGMSMLLFMVMSALGGSWWPLEMTPSFMQKIGHFTFNYWAVSGIKKIIMYDQTLPGTGKEVFILILVCGVFLMLSDKVFQVE